MVVSGRLIGDQDLLYSRTDIVFDHGVLVVHDMVKWITCSIVYREFQYHEPS